jgi:hypothetical protein
LPLSRRAIRQCIAALAAATTGGCRLVQCLPAEPSGSVVGALTVPEQPLVVRGHVFSLESGEPVLGARVRVMNADTELPVVDSAGVWYVRATAPGAYVIDVAAPGYDPGSRAVVLRADSGLRWVAIMARSRASQRDRACGVDTTARGSPAVK